MALLDGEIKFTTLCFVIDKKSECLLMIEKRRGQGAGKWNVPGGKIGRLEQPEEAAIRETLEETGIEPIHPIKKGLLEFYFPKSKSWDNICHVYWTDSFRGNLVPESEECFAHWVPLNEIPFEKMWDDDRLWVPDLLQGKTFHRKYWFDEKDHMEKEENLDSTFTT